MKNKHMFFIITIMGSELALDKDKGKGDRQDREIKRVSQFIAFSTWEGAKDKIKETNKGRREALPQKNE